MVSKAQVGRHVFAAADGVDLVWRETGEGRPVLLLHGLFSDADTNWIRFGHAAEIASRGFRVIMPDLRGHGLSDAPHAPAAYPRDILARDGLELIAHLGLRDYDLGGYSLGGRTAVRMVVGGARPRRLVVSGMGLDGLLDTGSRSAHFKAVLEGLGRHERGSPEWMAEAFLKTTGGDPEALLPLLDSFVETKEAELDAIAMPTLVLSGADDHDNGSAAALAERLPRARYVEVPGNHMSAVTRPELGRALADFLAIDPLPAEVQ
jgi:pimeloyl-ACP methyl ester carboxylesterase